MGYNTKMKTVNELRVELAQMLVTRIKLDKFFDMYLDTFESKMDPKQPDTPVWKFYRKKYNEYDELCSRITSTEYQLKKAGYV
jgi:hypothetical protein